MNKTLSAIVLSACFLGLSACNKPVQVVATAPVADTSPVATPAPAVVRGPTTELEKQGVVKMEGPKPDPKVTPTTVKVKGVKTSTTSTKKTNRKTDVEKAAYLKAFFNKIEYVCIRKVVDEKIAEDIELGRIRDLGNIVDAFHKVDNMTFTQFCIQGGYVKLSDVKEFKGKV